MTSPTITPEVREAFNRSLDAFNMGTIGGSPDAQAEWWNECVAEVQSAVERGTADPYLAPLVSLIRSQTKEEDARICDEVAELSSDCYHAKVCASRIRAKGDR